MERISRMWRSGLSLILALCLIISACPVVAFAAEETINYVSLGDSMTNGYCFTGYDQGNISPDQFEDGTNVYGYDAYPNAFAQHLAKDGATVNHFKGAVSAMRAEDLNYLLGGRERPTDGWSNQVNYYSGTDDAKLKELYQEAVAEADVITMGIGNAAFGAYMVQYFTRMMGVMGGSLPEGEKVNLEKALTVLDADQQAVIRTAYNQMMAMAAPYIPEKLGPIDVQGMIDMMAYIGVGFLLNYEGALDQIVKLNPDVDVVLLGLMNTTYGMKVTGEGFDPIPIGDIVGILFDSMNAYIAALPTVKQAAGEWEEANFYYTNMSNPEFIVQVYDDLAEEGWPEDYYGLSGAIVRARTIKAYNENLREMIGKALGFKLPAVDTEDVEKYVLGNDYQSSITPELAIKWNTEIANLTDKEKDEYAAPYVAIMPPDMALQTSYMANKQISIAIYMALEESLAASVDTMDISLDGLMGIAGDIFGALGEMPTELASSPSPAVIKSALVKWFTGTETARAMCKVFAMFKVGDGMSVHPTPKAHETFAANVIAAYGEYTAKDETIKNVNLALSALKGFLEEYGPQAADQAYKMWVEMGYQDLVNECIDELNDAVTDRYTNYTEVILPAMNDAIDALNGQKDALNAELVTLKDQLTAKKAELLKVLSEQEITDITPPDFNIETELGNNEQTQVPENDCAGAGNVADELAAAIADLEHAIAVVEALIADVNADIEDMVALATEIAEGIASLEQTVADIATAAQDMKDAVDAVVDVLTNESAQATSKTFMNAFNAARDAAQIAVEAVELLVETVNDDFAAIEASVETLKEYADKLAGKFADDKDDILGKIMADIPMEGAALVAAPIILVQQALEQNKDAIIAALNAEKDALLVELNAEKDALLVELNNEKDALLAEYGPQIDKALADISNLQTTIDTEIQTGYAALQSEAQGKIDALKQNAQIEIDKLNAELQGYMDQLAGDISDELRAEIQPQIDRINNDIATINADLADAISHVNVELQNAYNALVAEVTNAYNQAMAELNNIHDALVEEYNNAVQALQDAYDTAVKNLQDAYDAAVEALQDAADKAINDLIDAAQKELDKLGQIGDMLNDVANGIFDAIRNDISNVQGAVAGILNGVQGSVDDLGDALVDTAVDGINALVDEVTDIINGMIYESTHSDLELSEESVYVALGDGTAASKGYAEELFAQLNAEYGVTGFENYAEDGNTVGAEIKAMAYERPMVADADLITIGFGNVTLLRNAMLNSGRVDYNWAELVGEDLVPYVEDALNEAYAKVEELGLPANWEARAKGIIEGMAYGTVEYMVELPELISAIRAVNPDAVIVIVGQYNPMDGVVLDLGGVTLDVSEYIDYFVEGVSAYGIGYSMITGDAIFVEAPEVATKNTDMSWAEDELIFDMLPDGFSTLNPNEAGAVYIANQILDALNITKIEVEGLLGDVNDDGVVDSRDMVRLRKYFADRENTTINFKNADVNLDGVVDSRDAVRMRKHFADGVAFG